MHLVPCPLLLQSPQDMEERTPVTLALRVGWGTSNTLKLCQTCEEL